MNLEGAPYGYTPFCDSRREMDGYRFWKTGYWASHLGHRKYHIRYPEFKEENGGQQYKLFVNPQNEGKETIFSKTAVELKFENSEHLPLY